MSQPVIQVENLSKAYRIGLKEEISDTLTQAAVGWVRAPLKNFKRLRRLNMSRAGADEDDILWALKDVSLDIHEGEVVGIIGRNGAGKSTLLKILSRITEPTSGRAVIRGRVSSLLEVGTGFHPELTGRENIYMNGTILGMTKREIDRKFDEIVDFSGVEKFLDTPTKRYSSGMQVRLAFAVAAHLEPEILIIDEVLAVGDAEFQKKCIGKMKNVSEGGRTVIFVSHNLAAVEALCSKSAEMDSGALVNYSSTNNAVSHYRNKMSRISVLSSISQNSTRLINRVRLIDSDGVDTSFVVLGGTFRLEIEFTKLCRIDNPMIGIGIDRDGARVLSIHTPAAHQPLSGLNSSCSVLCEIEKFPLAPGRYVIRVVLAENRCKLEAHDHALEFDVDDADAFGEGRGFHKGMCVAASTWRKYRPSES